MGEAKGFFGILWQNKTVLFLLIVCVVYLFYLAWLNQLVPNTEYITVKDPHTNLSQTKTVVHYPLDAPEVPKKAITNGHAWFGSALIFILVYLVLMKLVKDRNLIPFREQWELNVEKEVRYMAAKNYPEFAHPDSVGLVSHRMQYSQVGDDGERKPFVAILCFKLEKEGNEKFYVAKCLPYTNFILDIMETEQEMTREDSCARCGSFYYKDVYVKLPSDVGRQYQLMRGSYVQRKP